MIICVQGLGYVGSAMCVAIAMAKKNFKNKNFKVIGVDLPTVQGKKIINKINNGIFPFRSNDGRLKLEIKKCTKSGILNATESTEVFKKANIHDDNLTVDLDNLQSQGPGLYHIDNQYGCECGLKEAKSIQTSQPGIHLKGGIGWIAEKGCLVDNPQEHQK